MAKVSGGLFSVDARGSFAGAVVFAGSSGGLVAKKLTKPKNNKSEAQNFARNSVRVAAELQAYIAVTTEVNSYFGVRDKEFLSKKAPDNHTWSSYLMVLLVSGGQARLDLVRGEWLSKTPESRALYLDATKNTNPRHKNVVLLKANDEKLMNYSRGLSLFYYNKAIVEAGLYSGNIDLPQTYT